MDFEPLFEHSGITAHCTIHPNVPDRFGIESIVWKCHSHRVHIRFIAAGFWFVCTKRKGIRNFVGARDSLSDRVKSGFDSAEASTAENTRLILNVCFNYGGRWDIAQAATRLAQSGLAITETSLSGALSLAHCADPDLILRTGGETRISNFLLWQAAYSELYFSDVLWPDFDELELRKAFDWFGQRERRFGRTSAQLASQAMSNVV